MRARRLAVVSAFAVALGGAGVLVGMWLLLAWPPYQHTWPDFRSGSFGDLILLPLLTACLIMLGRQVEPVSSSRVPAVLASVIGGIVGALVQYQWWSDPQPPNSWSMAAPQVFSPAGAWHALFFTVMAGLLGGLWIDMLVVWRNLRRERPQRLTRLLTTGPVTGLMFTFVAFSGLVTLDSAQSADTSSSAATLVALAGVVVTAAAGFLWAAGAILRSAALQLTIGVASAGLITFLFRVWPPTIATWLVTACILLITWWSDRILRSKAELTFR